ncbi:MAG: hypothetical protein QM767_08900 [Anaeromyxobacter sp.]
MASSVVVGAVIALAVGGTGGGAAGRTGAAVAAGAPGRTTMSWPQPRHATLNARPWTFSSGTE